MYANCIGVYISDFVSFFLLFFGKKVKLVAKSNQITWLSDMHQHWALTLAHLDLSNNKLEGIPDTVCRLTALDVLLLTNNQLKQLPPREKCQIFKLYTLNIAGNQLVYKNDRYVSIVM